jgi:hypothetical protein
VTDAADSPVQPKSSTVTVSIEWAKWVRKFLVAVLGAITIVVTQGLVEGTAAKWCAGILAVATALGVGYVPNGSPPGDTVPDTVPPDIVPPQPPKPAG